MKTWKFLLRTLIIGFITLGIAQAQTEEQYKKALKSSKGKAIREARKEAKRLKKKGFSNIPGELPMAKQIERAMALQYMTTEEGNPLYFTATQEAKAETYAAARQQVMQLCIADIAGQIGSNVFGTIKSNVANAESLQDAASVTEVIGAYQNKVAAKLGRIVPVVTLKKMEKRMTHISMTVRYDRNAALEMVKDDLRKELKEKANLMQEDIDKLLEGITS